MEVLLLAVALVLGDFYVRSKFRAIGDRSLKSGDEATVRFFRKYEILFRVAGLAALFGGALAGRDVAGSTSADWIIAMCFGIGVLALTAATAWPILRWRR